MHNVNNQNVNNVTSLVKHVKEAVFIVLNVTETDNLTQIPTLVTVQQGFMTLAKQTVQLVIAIIVILVNTNLYIVPEIVLNQE